MLKIVNSKQPERENMYYIFIIFIAKASANTFENILHCEFDSGWSGQSSVEKFIHLSSANVGETQWVNSLPNEQLNAVNASAGFVVNSEGENELHVYRRERTSDKNICEHYYEEMVPIPEGSSAIVVYLFQRWSLPIDYCIDTGYVIISEDEFAQKCADVSMSVIAVEDGNPTVDFHLTCCLEYPVCELPFETNSVSGTEMESPIGLHKLYANLESDFLSISSSLEGKYDLSGIREVDDEAYCDYSGEVKGDAQVCVSAENLPINFDVCGKIAGKIQGECTTETECNFPSEVSCSLEDYCCDLDMGLSGEVEVGRSVEVDWGIWFLEGEASVGMSGALSSSLQAGMDYGEPIGEDSCDAPLTYEQGSVALTLSGSAEVELEMGAFEASGQVSASACGITALSDTGDVTGSVGARLSLTAGAEAEAGDIEIGVMGFKMPEEPFTYYYPPNPETPCFD